MYPKLIIMSDILAKQDPQLSRSIELERARQRDNLELIASENYVSAAVLAATASVLTNKYAEGYPGRRYYNGCEHVDEVERLAQQRACALFSAEYANVQPHSGSQANAAVYLSLLRPGDTILGMDLAHGGHLTHGSSVSSSGIYYRSAFYGVDRDSERLDYEAIAARARTARPQLIVCGFSAYSREIDFARFATIAREVGAHLLADISHISGLVATDLHPSPLRDADVVTTTTHKTLRGPRGGMILMGHDRENRLQIMNKKTGAPKRYSELIDSAVMPGVQGGPLLHSIAAKAVAFREALAPSFKEYQRSILRNARALCTQLTTHGLRIVSGGTDTHLFSVDVSRNDWTGKDAAAALDQAGITVNKNTIPFDSRSPFVASGIRIGTPAVTSRGMGTAEMEQIAEFIVEVLREGRDQRALADIRSRVVAFTRPFAVPGE